MRLSFIFIMLITCSFTLTPRKQVNFTMEGIMNNLESQYKPGEELNKNP